jgi:hypothetical protein
MLKNGKNNCTKPFRCTCINKDGSRCKRCKVEGETKCFQHMKVRCEEQINHLTFSKTSSKLSNYVNQLEKIDSIFAEPLIQRVHRLKKIILQK